MNNKIVAVAIVAVVAIAAVGVYFVLNNDDDSEMNVIGRVNTDGSGIFVVPGTEGADKMAKIVNTVEEPSEPHFGVSGKWVVFDKEAWGGKIITTPGPATIQHVQLKQIADTMGLKFVQYQNGTTVSNDTLYFHPGVGNYAKFKSEALNLNLTGGIMWEPQFSIAQIQGSCLPVATTNDLFPGHTCCVVASSHAYTSSHEDETVRFLAAYMKSVDLMTAAIEAGSGAEYDKVFEVAREKVSMTGLTVEQKNEAIKDAFNLVVYKYADDVNADDPLAQLKKDMADVANSMYESKQVGKTISDLGMTEESYGNAVVDSSFMKKALTYEKKDSYDTAKINVAIIEGDIHQLAIHYGIALGIFAEYGIDIELSGQSGGPQVFTAIYNGNSQFGFIGAPPFTINSINQGIISA